MYGTAIGRSEYSPTRSVVGKPEVSGAGNLILRVGRENPDVQGWSQTEHVVLTPDEAREFLTACDAVLRES